MIAEMAGGTNEDEVVIAFTTFPDAASGAKVGRILVEERLAACVSRVEGVVSIYRFEGAIHEDGEALLLIKTTCRRVPDLERRLVALHPYSVPEFVVVPAAAVGGPYAGWVRSVTET